MFFFDVTRCDREFLNSRTRYPLDIRKPLLNASHPVHALSRCLLSCVSIGCHAMTLSFLSQLPSLLAPLFPYQPISNLNPISIFHQFRFIVKATGFMIQPRAQHFILPALPPHISFLVVRHQLKSINSIITLLQS